VTGIATSTALADFAGASPMGFLLIAAFLAVLSNVAVHAAMGGYR
jgi:hypothetical protein